MILFNNIASHFIVRYRITYKCLLIDNVIGKPASQQQAISSDVLGGQKLWACFWLSGPLAPASFKGQLYVVQLCFSFINEN